MKVKLLYLLFFLLYTHSLIAQTEIFKTQISFTESELFNFKSSITLEDSLLFFLATDYKLYSINKNSNHTLFVADMYSKSNDPVFFHHDTLITSIYENKAHRAVLINKQSGTLIKNLNVAPLKLLPHFINDSVFISTIIDTDGGQLISYDVKNDKMLWNHFVGHGATKQFYVQEGAILANFDYDEWKVVTHDGAIEEEIYEEYPSNKKFKLVTTFYALAHDNSEITEEFIHANFSNTDAIKVKTTQQNTVLLNSEKLIVIAEHLQIILNLELNKLVKQPIDIDNDFYDILKIESDTVWFFNQNFLILYDFKKNKLITSYDLTSWNPHKLVLDEQHVWVVSKEDGQLYKLTLELTKKERRKAARL